MSLSAQLCPVMPSCAQLSAQLCSLKVINVIIFPGLQPRLLLPTNVVGPATPVQHERSRTDLSRLEIAHEDLAARHGVYERAEVLSAQDDDAKQVHSDLRNNRFICFNEKETGSFGSIRTAASPTPND